MAQCEICEQDRKCCLIKLPDSLLSLIKPHWSWDENVDRLRVCINCRDSVMELIGGKKEWRI